MSLICFVGSSGSREVIIAAGGEFVESNKELGNEVASKKDGISCFFLSARRTAGGPSASTAVVLFKPECNKIEFVRVY